MADNTTLDAGSGGDTIATASLTFSGDTAKVQIISAGILSGSEGSWTFTLFTGGAGAVSAGTPRVTLASDDPAVTALQIIDDWDETDRCKVNPIVGQAGVAAGAGAVGATTQRVTLASDDPAVTALQVLDNAISGSEMQVDIVAALPAGANVIGAVTQSGTWNAVVTNAGTFAVQVDGSALTALQLIDDVVYADDGAWTGDTSKHALVGGIYQSTPQTITDGRTAPIQLTANGYQIVSVNGTVAATQSGTWNVTNVSGTVSLPTGAATAANQSTANTALAAIQTAVELLDNTVSGTELQVDIVAALPAGTNAIGKLAANSGVDIGDVDVTSVIPGTGATNLGKAIDTATGATDTGVLVLATRDDALSALTPLEGDNVQLRVDANGALWVGVSGTVTVGSHAVTNAGTFAVQESGTALTRLTDIETNTNYGAVVGGGTEATALRVTLASDSTGVITVDNAGTFAVQAACTNAGTFAVQVDGSALTALQLIDDVVFTDDAAYTPGTSKLVVIGAQADEDSTDSVDEGDAGALRMTLERKLRVVASIDSASMQSGNDQVTPKFAVIDAATSGDNTLVAAVASKKIRVLSLFLVSSGTVNARFESGAGGTALTGQMNLVANSGFTLPFSPLGWFETAANTLLNLELSGAVSCDGCLTYIEVD